VIIIVCIILGLGLRLASGRTMASISGVHLRGEGLLLALLVAQAAVPFLRLTGSAAQIAYFIWLATFPCMIATVWLNRDAPGMALLGVGLFLNLIVIAANGGMPVFAQAAAMAKPGAAALVMPAGDFVHVLGTESTRLPWLADIMPLPGPGALQLVPSPGDLLPYSGIVAFLAGAPIHPAGLQTRQ